MNRKKEVIKVSVISIATNFLLVVFKAIIGFISGSISILMDALNNLSDALSSTITIVGTILASKAPDKEHPYGHGKIEYISSTIISIIIMITAISSLYESFTKILHPEAVNYTPIIIMLITVGIFVKLFLGKFVIKKGRILNSNSLVASGSDALFDAIISVSTLVGAIISYAFNINLDGYLGAFISIYIFKAGYEIIKSSLDGIIGTRISKETSQKLKMTIQKYDGVLGIYDLIIHEYGPEKMIGSVHIEVNDNLTAKEIHSLTRKISEDVFSNYGIILTIGIYATNTSNEEYAKIKREIQKIVSTYPTIKQIHGYYVDSDEKSVSCDFIFDFKEKNAFDIKKQIEESLTNKYPEYRFNIVIDNDFSD